MQYYHFFACVKSHRRNDFPFCSADFSLRKNYNANAEQFAADTVFFMKDMLQLDDNRDMDDTNFSQTVIAAVDTKAEWYDREALPALLDNYRLLHTCVKNIFDFLVKKALITADPYKVDKKISDIQAPPGTAFPESERATTIGIRLSDYESNVDFVCNYYKFSISNLTLANVKKLVDLNNSFAWSSFTPNSPKPNTRALAELVMKGRQSVDALTGSMISDSLSKGSAALVNINQSLKEITEFQKEYYKVQVRKNVFSHSGYDMNAASSSESEELAQIKKNFTAAMGKTPFYNELIDEIIREDHAPDKAELQAAVLSKLAVESSEKKKQEVKVDAKELIMSALRVFGAMPPQIDAAQQKLNENHALLQSEHNSLMDKLKRLLRRAFNIKEKPIFYMITITDTATETRRKEKINFQQFVAEIGARARRFSAVGVKGAPGYERMLVQPEEKILEFVSAQLAESGRMLKILAGLDDFFKQTVAPANKAKVKGIKMEITSLKNTVVKANQVRADYVAHAEEAEQMKKLGIENEM